MMYTCMQSLRLTRGGLNVIRQMSALLIQVIDATQSREFSGSDSKTETFDADNVKTS